MTDDEDQADAAAATATGGDRSSDAGPAGRRRRWPWILFLIVVVALAVASRVNLNYYAIQPGRAQSVQQFITVPADKRHPVTRPVLLTDVLEGRVNALSYLYYRLQSDTALYPLDDVTGGTPPSQVEAQGNLEMSQAEASAKTAALRRLGYPVAAIPAGAVVSGVYPGTPAAPLLDVGDVITAVDRVATPTSRALSVQLAGHHSGETVTLTVRRGGTSAPTPVPVTLKRTVVGALGGHALDLGVETEDQVDYTYPFPVSIDVTNIGGPSAGLAMTLGVIDALSPGSLTGRQTVAATGTIDSQGDVGDVGGVPQKTVAVENAGATIFLVPPQEYKEALSKDRPGLHIYAVSTLDQALAVLAAHGGSVPPAPKPPTPPG
jgi:PDZ domain-containing protein